MKDIEGAEPWSSPTLNDFPNYYDLPVTFKSGLYPVDAVYKDANTGQVLKTKDLGHHKAGEPVNQTFESKIADPATGQPYSIVSSYITPYDDMNDKSYVQNTGDPNLLDRHITTGVGGNHIVAEYAPTPPPTKDNPSPDVQGEDLDPNATGKILADQRGSEQFDVLKGIPTSDTLYVNVLADNYLYKYRFTQKTGVKPYTINITQDVTVISTDADGNQTTSKSTAGGPYTVYRKFSYWVIAELEVYDIKNATVHNYALPNGGITFDPGGGYAAPVMDVWHSDAETDHVTDPKYQDITLPATTVTAGAGDTNPDFSQMAEDSVPPITVNNDRLIFNTQTVMSDAPCQEKTDKPSPLPANASITKDMLYQPNQEIPPTLLNKANTTSDGTVYYEKTPGSLSGAHEGAKTINGLNTVTVHTPVVAYADISDDAAHNQKTVPTPARKAVILDRPFTVTLPTSGKHQPYKGYGTRDYLKYTAAKQVYFPFDVYRIENSGKKTFYKAGQWITVEKGQDTYQFYLPVWVDEGLYTVQFREIAINAPSDYINKTETNANLNLNHYIATDTVDVEVIGRLYNFHVTDIADYSYESVFRTAKNSADPTGVSYWVGDKDIDGQPRGNQNYEQLPVHVGSNVQPGYKKVAVKTGYHFKFDLETKGNMFGLKDGIRITPSFYFVSKTGGNTSDIPVKLYYRTPDNAFVEVGSPYDKEQRYVVLNTPLRNVPSKELSDTAGYIFDHYQVGPYTKATYTDAYFRAAEKQTWVGNYTLMMLTQPLRTFVGPEPSELPAGVDAGRAKAAIQKWYGEYSLPAAPYVVDAEETLTDYVQKHPGTQLDDKHGPWMTNGYIVVRFNIETIQNEDVDHPHLQYYNGPLDNQWKMEGFHAGVVDENGATFNLHDGDVMFYDTDHSSRDDFGSGGTH